jgi:hypothetical protein
VVGGIAAAAVAGIGLAGIAASLCDLAIIAVAGALPCRTVVALASIAALPTALRDLTIIAVASALSAGALSAGAMMTMMIMVSTMRDLAAIAAGTLIAAGASTSGASTSTSATSTSASSSSASGTRVAGNRGSTSGGAAARRRSVNRDRALRDAGDGSRALHCSRITDIVAAAERDIVAGDVTRIGDKTRARGLDLRLVRGQRIAGVAGQNALQALDRIRRVGVERAAEQFIVKASAEDPALGVIERRAGLLVILDLGDESLQLAGRRVVAGRDIVELIVDHVAFRNETGPKLVCA